MRGDAWDDLCEQRSAAIAARRSAPSHLSHEIPPPETIRGCSRAINILTVARISKIARRHRTRVDGKMEGSASTKAATKASCKVSESWSWRHGPTYRRPAPPCRTGAPMSSRLKASLPETRTRVVVGLSPRGGPAGRRLHPRDGQPRQAQHCH